MSQMKVYRNREEVSDYIAKERLSDVVNSNFILEKGIPIYEVDTDGSAEAFVNELTAKPEMFAAMPEHNLFSSVATDREALIEIFRQANGTSWEHNMNWLSNEVPVSKWYGVTTEDEIIVRKKGTRVAVGVGRVVGLNLSHNDIYRGRGKDDGIISPRIGDLTALRRLHLGYNFLTGRIPDELYSLVKLEELYLHFNQFSGGISSKIGNLVNLRKLQLDHNRLTGPIPVEIGKLTKLERLCLHENNLDNSVKTVRTRKAVPARTKVIPGKPCRIRWITVEKEIEIPIPDCIADLDKLNLFYAYNNQLQGDLSDKLKEVMSQRPEWQLVEQQDKVVLG